MTVSTNNYQIGQSALASQNFVLGPPAVADGTLKLQRGNPGATTQDILTVDANGKVLLPGDPAWTTVAGTVTSASGTLTSASAYFRTRPFGKTLHFSCSVDIFNNGTGAGNLQVVLPGYTVPSEAQNFTGREVLIAGYPVMVYCLNSGADLRFFLLKLLDATYPGGTGVGIKFNGSVEIN